MSISLKGYKIFARLRENTKTVVYQGERLKDCQKVAIEFFKHQYPTILELDRLRNQYIITKNLNLPGAIATYSLESYGNGLALIMEDFSGITLENYLINNHYGNLTERLTEFWQISQQIAEILDQFGQHQIVHQKIQPQNILIDPDSKQIKIIDFSLAALLPKYGQLWGNSSLVEDTLAYIAPEQTGRMNRGIDRRTDFYLVGVTFYQLLTGQLPFTSRDAMELVHSHLAIAPVAPEEVNPQLPGVLSAIILKLMDKNPEDRYQTALGLKYDLEQCQQQWQKDGCIVDFTLGARDICDRLKISQKLYGRERELEILLQGYLRVCRGNREMLLVAGAAGIGKTALIRSLHQEILRQQGYFIEGKFDQFQRNRPLSAIVQAFSHLINKLQLETPTRLQQWRERLTAALGDNGQIIIDVIPELELIIGKQTVVAKLEPAAAQNRFNLTFSKFIRAFATAERPLVIFLDDLQWADLASLKLIRSVIENRDTNHLLFIGAYRHNEVNSFHPLRLQLQEIEREIRISEDATVALNYLDLTPLDATAINSLIAESLCCSENLSLPLTEIIWQKTGGNPFFTRELLYFLHQEGLISFDRTQGCWQCDIAKVRVLTISDDVVEFMSERIGELSERTQRVLKIAACMSDRFNLATLAIALSQNEVDTAIDLRQALTEGLILPVSEIYQLIGDFQPDVREEIDSLVPYQFLHDRVRQAAYNAIAPEEKSTTHYQIGNLLLNSTSPETREAEIFAIVNHLNLAVELIQDTGEREYLAELNLTAGLKAKDATAYDRAWNYFATGLRLLSANAWEHQYDLTLALSLATAEAAYLNGDLTGMELLVKDILSRSRSLLERVRAHEIEIQAQIAGGKPLVAVEIALEVLKSLGIEFPLKPSKLKILLALVKTKLTLMGKSNADLLDLPLIQDPVKLAAGKIMMLAGSSAYSAAVELVPLLALTGIDLSVKYGNAPISTYGYAGYSIILCGYLGDIEAGYNYGKLALDLVDKLDARELKAKNIMMFNNFVRHWKEHILDGLPTFKEAYGIGLETGDFEFAAYSAYMYCYHSYFVGRDLKELADEMQTYGEGIRQCGQETVLRLHRVYHQATLNLLGESSIPHLLLGRVYDEEINLQLLLATNHRSALFDLYFHKLMFYYWFGYELEAEQCISLTEQYLDSAISTPSIPIFNFYTSLVLLKLYEPQNYHSEQILKKVNKNQQKLSKWAHHAPMNYLHKYYLVAAEQNRVLEEYTRAIEYYDLAIQIAKNNRYFNEQALAQELAAKFYLAWGK
jgi:predicted ATPase